MADQDDGFVMCPEKLLIEDPRLPQHTSWPNMLCLALASWASYNHEDEIIPEMWHGAWTSVTRSLPKCDGRYFVVTDDDNMMQTLAIRGTKNMTNAVVDLEFVKDSDADFLPGVSVNIHTGFDAATKELWNVLEEHNDLKPGYKLQITGHSLGGAMAAIVGLKLQLHNHNIERIVTFGQPKFTDEEGCKTLTEAVQLHEFPLIRVINKHDPVATMPPTGGYAHCGPEIWLGQGLSSRVHMDHKGGLDTDDSFWRNLSSDVPENHTLAKYVSNLQPFSNALNQVVTHVLRQ